MCPTGAGGWLWREAAGGGAAAARHCTVGATPAPLLRAVLAHGTLSSCGAPSPSTQTILFLFKDFPTRVSAKFRGLLFETDLEFFGEGDEII